MAIGGGWGEEVLFGRTVFKMNLYAFSKKGLSPSQCLQWFADEHLMTSSPKIIKVCICMCIYTQKFVIHFTDIKDV